MPVAAQTSRGRRLLRGIMLLLLIAGTGTALWFAGTRGLALAWADTAPERALRLWPDAPEALVRINETETDPAARQTRAQQLLTLRPADARGYRQLAEVAEATGRVEKARALYQRTVLVDPRDRLAQAWLADDALRRADAPAAVAAAARIAAMDGALKNVIAPLLVVADRDPAVHRALRAQLAEAPIWRPSLLVKWGEHAFNQPGLDRILVELTASGDPRLSRDERWVWTEYLLRASRWTAAYLAWVGHDIDLPGGSGLFDGGFDGPARQPFGWQIPASSGARADLVRGEQGSALRVEVWNAAAALSDIGQTLLLAPGRYTATFRTRVGADSAVPDLGWQLLCRTGDVPLGVVRATRPGMAWQAVRFEFDVPDACPAQRLRLAAATTPQSGVVWFDDMAVTRTGVEAPTTITQRPPTVAAAAGEPVAVVVDPQRPAQVVRAGLRYAADYGQPLWRGDVVRSGNGELRVRWRGGCASTLADGETVAIAPCPDGAIDDAAPQVVRELGALDAVRAWLRENRAAGGPPPDLPAAP